MCFHYINRLQWQIENGKLWQLTELQGASRVITVAWCLRTVAQLNFDPNSETISPPVPMNSSRIFSRDESSAFRSLLHHSPNWSLSLASSWVHSSSLKLCESSPKKAPRNLLNKLLRFVIPKDLFLNWKNENWKWWSKRVKQNFQLGGGRVSVTSSSLGLKKPLVFFLKIMQISD